MDPCLRWSLEEVGRLALCHRLDPAPLGAALGLDPAATEALVVTGAVPVPLPAIHWRVAAWVLNILVRLEVRCGGDSAAIRAAMTRSSEALGGVSIADALLAGPDLIRLAEVRTAAGTLPRAQGADVAGTRRLLVKEKADDLEHGARRRGSARADAGASGADR